MTNFIKPEDILNKINIVDVVSRYITLSKKGKDYVGLCPFHDDHSPSLHVSQEKQIFKCFTCGKGGNLISFIKEYENIEYKDAIYKAAEYAGIKITKEGNQVAFKKEKDCLKQIIEFYNTKIELSENKTVLEYCERRGLNSEVRDFFNIGYSPTDSTETITLLKNCGFSVKLLQDLGIFTFSNNKIIDINSGRLIFPIMNLNGEYVGLSSRKISNIDNSPKYINSPETKLFHKSEILYNYYNAKKYIKDFNYLYIVEGFIDCIALYKADIKSCIALMGTSLSNKKVLTALKILKCEIRLCLDNDSAGQQATYNISKTLIENDIPFRIVAKSDLAKDCGEILDKYGKEDLIKYLNNLYDSNDFIIDYAYSKYKNISNFDKENFLKELYGFFKVIKSEINQNTFLIKISKKLDLREEIILKYWKRVFNNANKLTESNLGYLDKEVKKYNKLEQYQRNITNYILNNVSLLNVFRDESSYFYDEIYEKILLYLNEYLINHSEKFDYSKFISFIEERDEEAKKQLDKIYESKTIDSDIFKKKLSELKGAIIKLNTSILDSDDKKKISTEELIKEKQKNIK